MGFLGFRPRDGARGTCELCDLRTLRRPTYDEAEYRAHLLDKHRNHPDVRGILALQRDRLEGFAWRGSSLPKPYTDFDGRCPVCGPAFRLAVEPIYLEDYPTHMMELLGDHLRQQTKEFARLGLPHSGPPSHLRLFYCRNDGTIVRIAQL